MGQDRQRDPVAVSEQYANDGNLATRQSIYAYQHPRVDLQTWALDLAQLRGTERVLDVGCGNGMYIKELWRRAHAGPVVGVDQSLGMLEAVGAGLRARADVQRLPFRDHAYDVVLAMHMLYHVPDRAAGIAELRRVLRPEGVALVVTNSESHLRELRALFGRDLREQFTVENGRDELEQWFDAVEVHDSMGALEIGDLEPLRAYAESMMLEVDVEAGLRGAADLIARDGLLRIRTAVGCFVCR